jgi:Zn-dependent protease
MRMSWKLGRVAGIDLFLHWSFLLVFLFTGNTPVIFVLALFGCVVLHELGHALMARRFGIETADITLYPIGGVARLTRMPRAPGAELMIALAGPAVNFAIVAILMGLLAIGLPGPDSLLSGFFESLVLMNLVLGLFNLIPAFPMDGGRVLRALLSGWLGRVQATTVAATIGRVLAVLFGLYSLPHFFTNPLPVFLAAFIYVIAGNEEASVVAEERRRAYEQAGGDQAIWTAPAGYRWVRRGDGVWQLAPIIFTAGRAPGNASTWGS